MEEQTFTLTLHPDTTSGLTTLSDEPPMPDGVWYSAQATGAALSYRFPAGTLSQARYLSADWLLDGNTLAVFVLRLQEGEEGPVFRMTFGFLNQCLARMRIPLEAVNQSQWRYPREGAWLKPLCGGDRVDLHKVDRLQIVLERKGPDPVRFCLTPVTASETEPPRLTSLILPAGPILDELGQSTLRTWPTKTPSVDALVTRLQDQLATAPGRHWPSHFSKWGGWRKQRVEATGFFRTHHDGKRWWLVDPEGYLFWSSGLDCVRFGIESAYEGLEEALTWLPPEDGEFAAAYHGGEPRAFDYLRANFIRAFGPEAASEAWSKVALSMLKEFGFNTVANWSDWEIAQGTLPYVRPMDDTALRRLPAVYRDFPDVYHPDFEAATADFAAQLKDTVDDPAFLGYFLMNEPTWGFASETPAAGMLYTTEWCHSRRALVDFLQARYTTPAALAEAWGMNIGFGKVAEGKWTEPLSEAARADLAAFSELMVSRYFRLLSQACREVDPNHLNLGIRYYTVPPWWAVRGMRGFDVFSMNCYRPRVPADEMAHISETLQLPIMIGEWHFGALDAGLPASGIGHVPSQADRGRAFRVYLEDAAAKPWCVGVHYFTLYDQSAIGRFDGENYNIGFVDVCHRPYEPLAEAARLSHERLYSVAAGQIAPYDDPPTYLPRLFV